MEFNHIRVTTMRPFTMKVRGKINQGIECIAYSPTNRKIKIISNMTFTLPLMDEERQMTEMVKDVYNQLIVEEKKCELFFQGINNKDHAKGRR